MQISSDVLSFTCTNCRNLESSVERALGNPFCALFSRVLVWSTTLNAFEKSANVAIVSFTSLHNLDDAIFEVQTSNTVVVK